MFTIACSCYDVNAAIFVYQLKQMSYTDIVYGVFRVVIVLCMYREGSGVHCDCCSWLGFLFPSGCYMYDKLVMILNAVRMHL